MKHAAWIILFVVGIASAGAAEEAAKKAAAGGAKQAAASMPQAKLKAEYMRRLTEFTQGYDKDHLFAKWICMGKPAKFRARLMQDALTINVDPNVAACASYNPKTQVLTIQHPPMAFGFSVLSSGTSSLLLWHEAAHAISHGHQIGAIKPSRPFKGIAKKTAMTAAGNLPAESGVGTVGSMTSSGNEKYVAWAEEAVDHLYLEWVERCMESTNILIMLERVLKDNGKAKPATDVKARTQRLWRRFVERANSSGFGQVPNDDERKELEAMTGFRFDPNEILSGYLGLGYPMEYFGEFVTDAQVWKLFPTAQQLGTVGMKVHRSATNLGNLSRNYVLCYKEMPTGRVLTIHLSLYGSTEISKTVWTSLAKLPGSGKRRPVTGLGEQAYTLRPGATDATRLHARFWNASALMTDAMLSGNISKGTFKFTPRAPRPQILKKLFVNIESLGMTPIPPGVITAIPKKPAKP